MTDELFKILLLFSIAQGIAFSALLIFKKKGNTKANILLALFILLTIIPLWNDYAVNMPVEVGSLRLDFSWLYLPAFYGPLLYLYTLSYTRAPKPSNFVFVILLLAPVIGAFIKITHVYVLPNGLPKSIWLAWYFIIYAQIGGCIYAACHRITEFEHEVKQNLSNIDKAKTDWLKLLFLFYIAILLVALAQTIAKSIGVNNLDFYKTVMSVAEAVFIFSIGLWGLNKSDIHFSDFVVRTKEKYSKSALTDVKANMVVDRLNVLMKNEEPYLDSDISLIALAEKLQVTPHHLSQVINEKLQQNFYDFINSARIERAKEMLSTPDFKKLPIIDIAYQVGFNNKTSFNNSFKKYTHLTPSQFRATSL
ncbi:helix-turn-helix domain-containing protein [Colwelliaceae bacterium 6441]